MGVLYVLFGNLCPADSWADFKGLRPDSCPMKIWPALCFCFYFFCLFMIWLWWDLLWSRLIIFPHKLLSLRSAESKTGFRVCPALSQVGFNGCHQPPPAVGSRAPRWCHCAPEWCTVVQCATVGSWRGAVVRPIGEQPVEGRPAGITVSRM